MKKADVRIGETYLTYVGQELVPVVVIGEGETSWTRRSGWRVKRYDNGKELPKTRTSAALRECPERELHYYLRGKAC